ncbi:MAG: hypothetical protein V1763_02805 [Parcubacteria group bacterium]
MKIMAIGFYGNTITHLNALKAAGWCDTYYLPPNKTVGGIPGTLEEIKALNIPFEKYDAALIFQEALSPAQIYFNEQCVEHGITIYANQHGFNKSILQIADHTPNIYSKYWNCMGQYFIDRFKDVTGREASTNRWVSLGSLMHDYLYKNFQWHGNKSNGRALIIHEPDLSACEGDPCPHDSEAMTRFIVDCLKKQGIAADMKPHPNWKNFIGNSGDPLDRPDVPLVDIKVEEIVNYSLVIGSRSTMLLDAAAMGIPTIALVSDSSWQDDKYPPVEKGGLIPTYDKASFADGLTAHFNKKPNYNQAELNYFVGDLGNVADKYRDFIEADLREPKKVLGDYYDKWQEQLSGYRRRENSLIRSCWRRARSSRLLSPVKYLYHTAKKYASKQ